MKSQEIVRMGIVAAFVSSFMGVHAAEQQFTTQAVKSDQMALPAFVRVDRPFNRGWTYHLEGTGTSRTVEFSKDLYEIKAECAKCSTRSPCEITGSEQSGEMLNRRLGLD